MIPSSSPVPTTWLIFLDDIVFSQPLSAAVATKPFNWKNAVDPLVNPGVSRTWPCTIPDTLALLISKAYTQVHALGLAGEVVFAAHRSGCTSMNFCVSLIFERRWKCRLCRSCSKVFDSVRFDSPFILACIVRESILMCRDKDTKRTGTYRYSILD
ncbi:hypothetical protein CSAL01_03003 [Colletotrichum salicis]|uniref:Uncharacterized protein n=1 Tax=Colletotrichum salicis TaxID=1209931 RepID=A0A135SUS7_9PEZI|nr:hypothetical protein CSAL01_03003 [Colletotrichum salicis]